MRVRHDSSAPSSFTPRDAFSSTASPGRVFARQPLAGLARRVNEFRRHAGLACAFDHPLGRSAHANAARRSSSRRSASRSGDAVRSSMAPVPASRRRPRCAACAGDVRKRRHHRAQCLRIGIVAIVHHGDAGNLDHLSALVLSEQALPAPPRPRWAECPCSSATATAASALYTLCIPSSGKFARSRQLPATTFEAHALEPALLSRLPRARQPGAARAKVITRPLEVAAELRNDTRRRRSAPPSRRRAEFSISSYLARAIAATDSKNSRCTGPTLVTTADVVLRDARQRA